MSNPFQITFSLAPLPTGIALNANDYGALIAANLQAHIAGNFLTGQVNGTAPTSDIGPWFNNDAWLVWNSLLGKYTPITIVSNQSCIINGQTNVWQRNTTFVNPVSSSYTADRYVYFENLATGVATVSRNASTIPQTTTTPLTEYSYRTTVTTPQSNIAASEICSVFQHVERQMGFYMFNEPTSLQVTLRSNKVGTYCVFVRNSDSTQSFIHECAITQVNTPTLFQIQNIPLFPSLTGNWGTLDTDRSFNVGIVMAAGLNSQSPTADAWVSGGNICTVNQANLFSNAGNYLDFSLLKYESGSTCTPYAAVPFDQDLQRCQRYYNKTYDYNTFPSVNLHGYTVFSVINTTQAFGSASFPCTMNGIPAITFYSPNTAATSTVRSLVQNADIGGISVLGLGDGGFGGVQTSSAWTAASNAVSFHYTAEAEL